MITLQKIFEASIKVNFENLLSVNVLIYTNSQKNLCLNDTYISYFWFYDGMCSL